MNEVVGHRVSESPAMRVPSHVAPPGGYQVNPNPIQIPTQNQVRDGRSSPDGGGVGVVHNGTGGPWMSKNREYEMPKLDLVDEQIRNVDPLCLQLSSGEHPLEHAYSMWFSRRVSSKQGGSAQKFEDSLKLLCTFRSVERFWKYYTHFKSPSDLNGHVDYHLFKHGVKPMWEDPTNRDGGKWIVRLRKGVAARCWENVVLAILGEQFLVGDEICGAVMSVRYNQEDIISVWNRTADDDHVLKRTMETLRRVMNLPSNQFMEYKRHNSSLQDNCSFRNTEIRR